MSTARNLKGMIVEESLTDNRILNGLEFIDVRITVAQRPEERWHIYTVRVSREDIERFQQNLKHGTWYMHFWDEARILVVFPDKIFELDRNNKKNWKVAIDHGLHLGIPAEQLDFLTT